MNVASRKLSQELYKLSGWQSQHKTTRWEDDGYGEDFVEVPAYDLGYLLRKLPKTIERDNYPVVSRYFREGWAACYEASFEYEQTERWHLVEASTPEDAACNLVIELFKQGVLKQDAQQDALQGETGGR